MCVCVCMGMLVPVSSDCKFVSRSQGFPLGAFWRYANWCLPVLSGFLGVNGNVFMSEFPTRCKSKMTEMLFCQGNRNDERLCRRHSKRLAPSLSHCENLILGQQRRRVHILIDGAQTVNSTMCWIFNWCCWQVLRAAVYLSISIIYATKACLCAPLRAASWPQWFL